MGAHTLHDQWRDSGFPRGGRDGCANLLFSKFFAAKCMNMKEFGPGGEHVSPARSSDPPMMTKRTSTSTVVRRQELNCRIET